MNLVHFLTAFEELCRGVPPIKTVRVGTSTANRLPTRFYLQVSPQAGPHDLEAHLRGLERSRSIRGIDGNVAIPPRLFVEVTGITIHEFAFNGLSCGLPPSLRLCV